MQSWKDVGCPAVGTPPPFWVGVAAQLLLPRGRTGVMPNWQTYQDIEHGRTQESEGPQEGMQLNGTLVLCFFPCPPEVPGPSDGVQLDDIVTQSLNSSPRTVQMHLGYGSM